MEIPAYPSDGVSVRFPWIGGEPGALVRRTGYITP